MNWLRSFLFSDAGGGDAGGGGGSGGNQTLMSGGTGDGSGGGGNPPPAAPTGWTNDAGAFAEGWSDRLEGDIKGHASLKALGSVGDLAKAYVETKKLVGSRLEAPNEKSTPEQVAAWRKTVGAPETPEGYLGDAKTLRPEVIPESMWDPKNEKALLDVAHKHHLTPAALKDILGVYAGQVTAGLETHKQASEAHLAGQMTELKKAWGNEFDANLGLAGRVAKTVGLSPDHPIFTDAEVVIAFGKLGKMFSETSLVSGDPVSSASGGLTARITEITDPKSTALIAREYRGEFGAERQQQAAEAYRGLLKAQMEVKG